MILTDVHTHSKFSTDGKSTLEEMVSTAKARGLRYFGVSEHFDLDESSVKCYGTTDYNAYFLCARRLQEKYNDERFTFLAGGELGFADEQRVRDGAAEIAEKYHPDFIVNSIHNVNGADCYLLPYFEGKSKHLAYGDYLKAVSESLDAPYSYDIVGHVGYVSRHAPYEDCKIRYAEFADLYDEILRKIVQKGKILEVNSSSRGAGSEFLPDVDVLARYFELGGRRVSFGSDAHFTERIADKREQVVRELKKIGFDCITVPVRGNYISVAI